MVLSMRVFRPSRLPKEMLARLGLAIAGLDREFLVLEAQSKGMARSRLSQYPLVSDALGNLGVIWGEGNLGGNLGTPYSIGARDR
jgi:hypothetical protein